MLAFDDAAALTKQARTNAGCVPVFVPAAVRNQQRVAVERVPLFCERGSNLTRNILCIKTPQLRKIQLILQPLHAWRELLLLLLSSVTNTYALPAGVA